MNIDRKTPNDGVLYVGMNSTHGQCEAEARALRSSGPGTREAIGHGERDPELGEDRVRLGNGTIVDVSDAEEVHSFTASLGLSDRQCEDVATVLLGATPGSRDELAQIASVFARAERGGNIPSRWVFSGHSAGGGVYDGELHYGFLAYADVFALADAMPRAAAQVEDVMLSACSSGFADLAEWREHFPNLKTAWGYGGVGDFHSPTGQTAIRHIEAWEHATRGRREELHPHSAFARPVGYENNVSVWTVQQGWVQGR